MSKINKTSMASSIRPCAVNKCEISSCAVCHCCQNNLCLDHLKEHRDQLNAKLIPLANQINTFLDNLEHFTPTSLSSFKTLEQWRIAAHETVDQFYERMRHELFEQKKNKPVERLHTTRNILDQLIQKQGATRENIDSLTNYIRVIEQEIDGLQNIQINLHPLVIDENSILQSNASNRQQQRNHVEHVHSSGTNESRETASGANDSLNLVREETSFQIFVQLLTGGLIFVAIKPSDTVMELKRKIQDRTAIPIAQQYLTYMGKILKDDYTMATYDIQRQCTIIQGQFLKKEK